MSDVGQMCRKPKTCESHLAGVVFHKTRCMCSCVRILQGLACCWHHNSIKCLCLIKSTDGHWTMPPIGKLHNKKCYVCFGGPKIS